MSLPYHSVKKEALDNLTSRATSTARTVLEGNGGVQDTAAAASRKRKRSLEFTGKMVHITVANYEPDDDDNGKAEEDEENITFRVHEDVVHSYFPFFKTKEVEIHETAQVRGERIYNLSEYGSAQSMQVILDWVYLRELEESEITCEGLHRWGDAYNFAKFLQMPDFPTIITARVYADFSKHAKYIMENISQAYDKDIISEDYEWDGLDKVLLRIIAENTTPNELRRIAKAWPQRFLTELAVFFMERSQGGTRKPEEDQQAAIILSGKDSSLPLETQNPMTNEQHTADVSEAKARKKQKTSHGSKEIQLPGDDSHIARRITRSMTRKTTPCGWKYFKPLRDENVATKDMTSRMTKMASIEHSRELARPKELMRRQAAMLRVERSLGDLTDMTKGWVASQSTRFLNQFANLLESERSTGNAITKINICLIDRLESLPMDYPTNGIDRVLVVQSKDIIQALQTPSILKTSRSPRVLSHDCLLRHKLCFNKFGLLEPWSKEELADMARKSCGTVGPSTITNTVQTDVKTADMADMAWKPCITIEASSIKNAVQREVEMADMAWKPCMTSEASADSNAQNEVDMADMASKPCITIEASTDSTALNAVKMTDMASKSCNAVESADNTTAQERMVE